MKILKLIGIAALLTVGLTQPVSADDVVSKSDNVKSIAKVEYWGGSHLSFGGNYAYAGNWDGRGERPEEGGVRIMDLRGKPRQVGFFKCPGVNDADAQFVKPGLVAVGHHSAGCNPFEAGEDDSGIFLLDVRNPKKPKMIGSINMPRDVEGQDRTGRQVHSISVYPGKPLVYTNAGGLPSNGQMFTHMIDVSNPKKPEIVGSYRPTGLPTGCHDFSFHFDKRGKFGFCAGLQGTQIWDVSDPLAPTVVSTIYNPLIQFSHYAVASDDGKILAINDENLTANDCVEQETPTGAVWFYDISNIESPQFLSYHSPRRGGGPIGSFESPSGPCTSHDFSWIDNKTLAMPWYTGGFSVISVKDPTAPEEIAHYQPEGGVMWSAEFYKGRIYTNDQLLGFEAFEVKGVTD